MTEMGCSGIMHHRGAFGGCSFTQSSVLNYPSTYPGWPGSVGQSYWNCRRMAGSPLQHIVIPWFGPLAAQTHYAILRIRAVSQLSLGSGIGELTGTAAVGPVPLYNKHYTVSQANRRPGIFRRCGSRPLHSWPGCTISAFKGAAR